MRDENSSEATPLATESHEETAQRVFEGWDAMSPEEWAARYAHTVLCSSFDRFRYRNAALQCWIYRLHEILADPGKVRESRRTCLTAKEAERLEGSGL
jgi:hypothetical protein